MCQCTRNVRIEATKLIFSALLDATSPDKTTQCCAKKCLTSNYAFALLMQIHQLISHATPRLTLEYLSKWLRLNAVARSNCTRRLTM